MTYRNLNDDEVRLPDQRLDPPEQPEHNPDGGGDPTPKEKSWDQAAPDPEVEGEIDDDDEDDFGDDEDEFEEGLLGEDDED